MPVMPDQEVPQTNYSSYAPPMAERDIEGSVFGAAFRLENDVVNLIEYASRPGFTPDPTFDPMARAKDSPFFANNADSFMGIQSNAEWDFMEAKIAREYKDRALIEQAGVGGIAAAMAAGLLSPTILIPMGSVARAPTVASAAARGAGLTAFGIGIQEGVLHMNQETRTAQETAFAVGSGVVLGGLLGSAVRYLDPLDMDRIGADMVGQPNRQAILPLTPPPTTGGARQGLSAQAVPEDELLLDEDGLVDPGGLAPAFGKWLDRPLSRLGPITRLQESRFAGIRGMGAQFSTGGLRTNASLKGLVAAEDGDLESLVKAYEGQRVQAQREVGKIYYEYYKNRGGTRLGAVFNHASYKEFTQQVGEVLLAQNRGAPNNFAPEVNKAAEVLMEQVFRPMIQEAKNAGLPPFGRLSEDYALDIVLQKVSHLEAGRDTQAMKLIIRENALEQLQEARLKAEDIKQDVMLQELLQRIDPRIRNKFKDVEGKMLLSRLDDDDLQELAEEIAEELTQKHLSNGLRHGAVDILQSIGEKEAKYVYINPTRVWSNGRAWSEFLERDADMLARAFTRSISADTELYRRFKVNFRSDEEFRLDKTKFRGKKDDPQSGIPWVKQAIAEIDQARIEADKLEPKAKAREMEKIAKEEREFVRDINVLVGRLRHTWGQPADPTAVGHRMAKAVLQLNTMRLMGSVVLSSIPDLARPILKYGFTNTMKDGVLLMMRDMKAYQMLAKEAQYAGTGIDLYNHGRMMTLASQFEESEYAGTMVERLMQYGTSKIGIVGMFDIWNQELKKFSAAVLASDLSRAIEASGKGTPSAKDLKLLGGLNISQNKAKAMYRLMENGGGARTANGVLLPNTEDWVKLSDEFIANEAAKLQSSYEKFGIKPQGFKDVKRKLTSDDFKTAATSAALKERKDLVRAFRAALARGVDDTVITPGLERPNWMDGSSLGLLIGQFRSFTMSSTFKAVMASAQDARAGNMAPMAAGVMFSLALGMLSYYTWAHTVGGRTRERMLNELDAALNGDEQAMARWADEAITRSGLLGVFAEAQKVAERTPGLAPYATFAGVPPARSPYLNPAMELMGPWLGAVENLGRIAVTADDPTSETFRNAKQLMPYQNLFYLRQIFDWMNEAAMDAAGVDYR